MIAGSCLCGGVAFECDEAAERAHNCYCGRCRKARGAAFASNLFVPLGSFRWIRGESLVRSFRPPGADRFLHAFCDVCGSSLPASNPSRGAVVIPMGALDSDPGISPQAHIFVGSKASWVEILNSLPQYEMHTNSERINSET